MVRFLKIRAVTVYGQWQSTGVCVCLFRRHGRQSIM